MAARIGFSFVGIVLSAAFLAVGLLIAFWPATYLRWIRWSNVDRYPRWLVGSLDVYSWRSRIVGIGLGLFGVAAAILTVWISWFQ
jgi:hypothetical protein